MHILYILTLLLSIITTHSAQALSIYQPSAVACTMEARMCPDGTYVGRTGPNCEFTPCATHASTSPIVPSMPPKKCFWPTETLRLGYTKDSVKDLQNFLYGRYNTQGPVTGYFGTLTKSYVARFQKEYGLKADGIVGSKTRSAIWNVCQQQN